MASVADSVWPPLADSTPSNIEKGHAVQDLPSAREHAELRWLEDNFVENWMSKLADDIKVSSITIPGTHDSAAYTRPWPFIVTQRMTFLQQLNAGIRYFDLRCGLRDDVLEMVHGSSLLGLTFADVLATMYSWLEKHSQECLILQIKEDRAAERSTIRFSRAIFSNVAAQPERWRTANTTPVLGELRGKIQLFRRFNAPRWATFGINVTNWKDNSSIPFTIRTRHYVKITIQDHYNVSDPTDLPGLIAIKGGDVSKMLDAAAADQDASHWYVNFTSAYEFNLWYQLTPRQIAVGGYSGFSWEEGMNPRVRNYLKQRPGKKRLGCVLMDFPELGTGDLISTLIRTNFAKEKTIPKIAKVMVICLLLLIWLMIPYINNTLLFAHA